MKADQITGSDVTSGVKSNGKWIANESSKVAGEAAGQAESLINQASHIAADTYSRVADASVDLYENFSGSTTKFVKKYPLETAAGALAIGFLVGAFAFRRK